MTRSPSSSITIHNRCLLRFEYQLPHPILCTTLATDKNYPFKSFPYLLPKHRNQLTKNGPNISNYSALKALQIEVFKKKIIEEVPIFCYSSIFKAFKAFYTKIVPIFV